MASMHWANRPELIQRKVLPVLRVKPAQPVSGIILSDDLTGAFLHYSGRTIPHIEPEHECEGCKRVLPKRWEGYFAIWSAAKNGTALVAIPPGTASQFHDALKLHSSLRGLQVKLTRWSNKPNGRIIADFTRANLADGQLPLDPDVPAVLSHMWGLDQQPLEHKFHAIETIREVRAAAEELPLPHEGDALATNSGSRNVPRHRQPTAREAHTLNMLLSSGRHDDAQRYCDEQGLDANIVAAFG